MIRSHLRSWRYLSLLVLFACGDEIAGPHGVLASGGPYALLSTGGRDVPYIDSSEDSDRCPSEEAPIHQLYLWSGSIEFSASDYTLSLDLRERCVSEEHSDSSDLWSQAGGTISGRYTYFGHDLRLFDAGDVPGDGTEPLMEGSADDDSVFVFGESVFGYPLALLFHRW